MTRLPVFYVPDCVFISSDKSDWAVRMLCIERGRDEETGVFWEYRVHIRLAVGGEGAGAIRAARWLHLARRQGYRRSERCRPTPGAYGTRLCHRAEPDFRRTICPGQ